MSKPKVPESVGLIQSLQGQSGESQSVYKTRSMLAQFLENFLSDITRIGKTLSGSGGQSSECFMVLQFCSHTIKSNPEVFVCQGHPHSDEAVNQEKLNHAQEERQTSAFSTWVVCKLLRPLGYSVCSAIHDRCIGVVSTLLQLIKWRDAHFYYKLLYDVVHSLSDVVQINEKMYNSDDDLYVSEVSRFKVSMELVRQSIVDPNQESDKADVKISDVTMDISSIEVCDLFLLNFTKMFELLVCDLSLVAQNLLPVSWACLCWIVEFGDLELKSSALVSIGHLLADTGLPSPQVVDYFLACVVSLLDYICAGCKDADTKLVIDVEEKLGQVLHKVVQGDKHDLHLVHLTLSQNQYILSKVAMSVSNHNFVNIQLDAFKLAMADVVCHCFDGVPCRLLSGSVYHPLRSAITSALVSYCGKSESAQFVVQPMVRLIMSEISAMKESIVKGDLSEKSSSSENMETSGSQPLSLNQGKRKRKADDTGTQLKYKPCGLQRAVTSKLKTLLTQLAPETQEMQAVDVLEGVRVCVEILIRCLSLCRQEDKQEKLCSDNSAVFDSWLTVLVRQSFIDGVTAVLQKCSTWSSQGCNKVLTIVLKTLSTILCQNVAGDLSSEEMLSFCWMSSLPWLPNDPSWMDLKLPNTKQIVKISQHLSEKLEELAKHESLRVISLLPKDIAPKWRVHVFRQAFSDSAVEMMKSAMRSFPMLLQHLGPNANHLVYELVHPVVKNKNKDIQTIVAEVAGTLACVVCRKTVISKKKTSDINPLLVEQVIQCVACDNLHAQDSCKSSKERPKLVDPNMFSPFLALLQTDDTQIKTAMIDSLSRIFGHIGMRTNNSATVNMLNTCLSLIEDRDYHIRVHFSKVIKCLVGETSSDTNQLIVKKLKETLNSAEADHNTRLQETIILTVAQLGRVAEDDLILVMIISLLESLLSKTPLIAAVAYEQLKLVAQHKKTKTQTLFMKSRLPICKFLVEAMHAAQTSGGRTPDEILRDVSRVLDFNDVRSFLQIAGKYMVPHLVSKATAEASKLIKMMATILNIPSRMKLLIDQIKYVFSYLVCYCNKTEMERAITFLQNETDFELGGLLRLHFQRVHQQLLLNLSTHYSQVFNGLRLLATYDDHYTGPKDITTSEQMADYLQPRLLGVIAFFDSQLLTASTPLEDKKLTLESLTSIIRLMGQRHIGSIRHKVVNTLRIGLDYKNRELVEVSCRAWNCFVRSLDMQFLGQMMSQIIATLLPLIEVLPRPVCDIITFMIVDNRRALNEHFREIYFLPDIPELTEANAILKQYVDGPSSQSDLKTLLKHSMKGISHESVDVRRHALSNLRKLLQDEKEQLCEYVIGNETADPVISQLISVLLEGCRESDSRAQCLYAECIGELGAIDPGKLELLSNDPKAEIAKFQASIRDDNFIIGLINEGVKAFLAATETRIQDCAAFALQELLKNYKITEPNDSDPGSGKIWRRFPEHVKEILVPFFTSKYALSKQSDWSKQNKPIYNSEKGHNFHDWVSTWTGYLSSKVKSDSAKEVFLACSAAIKHTNDIALYLLPHIVLQVLQDGSKEDINDLYSEIMEVLTHATKPDSKHRTANFYHLSAQTVFSIIDYLTKWLNYIVQVKALDPHSKVPGYLKDTTFKSVKSFLMMIPQDVLADACYNCKAYTRALMHFEQFVNSKGKNVQEHLDFMQRLYMAMDEPDGVLGVTAIKKSQPSMKEQILTHESLGQHQDAQCCYERAIQKESDDVTHHQGLVRCLMELGQQCQALHHATAAIEEKREWAPHLNPYMIEAAWKLGNWQKLETYMKADKHSKQFSVGIGKILLSAKDGKEDELKKHLQIVRREQLGPLSAASMESGSYHRGYEYIARLHMLNEIEEGVRVLMNLHTEEGSEVTRQTTSKDLLQHWESRLQLIQCSFRTQEPILTMRRTLFTLAHQTVGLNVDGEIGHWWLCSAKIAQTAGYLQMAYSSLLQANDYSLPEVFLEKAQWLWHKSDKDKAITTLDRGISQHFSDLSQLKLNQSEEAKSKLKVYAKALLLYGCYSEETSSMESNSVLKKYKEVTDIYPNWEDGHFHLAKYYDKIMTYLVEDKDKSDPDKKREFILCVVKSFGQSLQFGNQYIYQSMPRLLSLWLDFGTSVVDMERRDKMKQPPSATKIQNSRDTLAKLNKIISVLGQKLAPYQLFTAFSQLISRICHAQPDVFQQLKEIIARLFVQFPQQALWMMMAVSKSSYHIRVKRCQDIFATAIQMNPQLQKFIQDATKLTDKLLDLCNRDITGTATVSLNQHFKPLKRLLDDRNFSNIILPLQSAMTVMLPNIPGAHHSHNPFPGNLIYISGIEDTIEILPSLQRPKKITLRGSDGHFYVMMCKPKDDLRKDCRLMEFNTIVNKFLKKDPESRKRQLYIRTYAVVPLNEECGLLEWVNNTSGLRHILLKLYKEKGMYTSGKELKTMMPKITDSLDIKMQMFKEKMMPRHPPVFKEWFLRIFPDPTAWYNARLSYARTAAVISMVGYILGLGDRHGENILFDSTNGDCVHVDFNCLFNKGETFEWAEKVPFRLTHNMMDALGPLGFEGIFRRACEVTLRVMRTQMDPLMSILNPFVFDPLVEWKKPAKGQRTNLTDTGEITNEQAKSCVTNIEHRLKGMLKYKGSKPRTVPLSIEGHVNHLIHEATDEKNLCQMYIGWAPYM